MHSHTCVDVVALVVDVFHSTLSNVGANRAEVDTIVVFSTADIWRARTKIVA
jgi:hypothetical protein